MFKRGKVGKTHELVIGSDEYFKKGLLFVPLKASDKTIEKIKFIYKRFQNVELSDKEAKIKLDNYPTRIETPIIFYCATEEVKRWFKEFKNESLSDNEAEKILYKYLPLRKGKSRLPIDPEELQKSYRPSEIKLGRVVHRHWEIKQMYDYGAGRTLEHFLPTMLVLLIIGFTASYFISSTLPTGYSVFEIEHKLILPLLILSIVIVLIILKKFR